MKTTPLPGLFMLLLLSMLPCTLLYAQEPPVKQWDKTFGGNSYEEFSSLQQTSDGGYILGGSSSSGVSGDKTGANKGNSDYWVVKVDSTGNKQWDKTYGGSDHDVLTSLQQTSDGGYILGGFSYSGIKGNKSAPNLGFVDFWVVKINAKGNKQWDKTYGGSDYDALSSLRQTSDGGYILGGTSSSDISGTKTTPWKGGNDYWVVKIDSRGNTQWDKTFSGDGGTYSDFIKSVQQTADGGYILGGMSASNSSADKSENCKGGDDYWVIKLDSIGNKQWDRTIGGSGSDWFSSLQQTSDGGYILGGYSYSNKGGSKTKNSKGRDDFWIVKINAKGKKQWDKTIGGDKEDELYSLQQTTDGGYILGGSSHSTISGDKTEDTKSPLSADYWIVKVDNTGKKQWDKTYNGTDGNGFLRSLQQTSDGGYILGGNSDAQTGADKTENSRGGDDYWIVKLNNSCTPNTYYQDSDGDGYGDVAATVQACSVPLYYVADSTDCNDKDKAVHAPVTYYRDADKDGYGDAEDSTVVCSSTVPQDYVANKLDNCPSVYNPDQTDIDKDGKGNVCDDSDGDSIADAYDCDPLNKKVAKYLVCHKGKTLCVDAQAVIAHLAHGDYLGKCTLAAKLTDATVQLEQSTASVYPNPTNGQFTLRLNNAKGGNAQLLIVDVKGVAVSQKLLTLTPGVQTIRLNLQGKANGLYLLKVTGVEGSVQTFKVYLQQ